MLRRFLQGCDGIVHVNLQRRHLAAAERRAVVAKVVQEEVKQLPSTRVRQLIEPPPRIPKAEGPARIAMADTTNRRSGSSSSSSSTTIKI